MYPIPLAPGAQLRLPVDVPHIVRPAWQRSLPRRRRLAVIDTHFPWKLSGFRYQEALELLRQQPSTEFFSLWPLTDPFPKHVHSLESFPQIADELGITDAYWVFLHTSVGLLGLADDGGHDVLVHEGSYMLRRTFDELGIRKHVMLWPGGGMVGRTPPSVIRAVGRHVDTVFTNVSEVERAVPDAMYIPMAVDTGFYQPRERSFDDGAVRLIFAGADSDRKGLGTLLAAFARLPPDRFHLTVVGPHERHAAGMAADNVDVVGWSTPEELRAMYWKSHAFVSPATTETQNPDELGMIDGFPTTTGSDATATGCALVASNPRNEHRALHPGIHYVDVPVDDVDGLTTALLALEQDRATLRAVANEGAQRVATFSIERVVDAKLRTMGFGPFGLPRLLPSQIDLTTTPQSKRPRVGLTSRVGAANLRARSLARDGAQRVAGIALRPALEAQGARDASIVAHLVGVQRSVEALEAREASIVAQLAGVQRSVDDLDAQVHRVRGIASSALDDIPTLRTHLARMRSLPEYDAAFDEPEPLVTVRIATFNLAAILIERSLASVCTQTYERLEIIVVGDACTDDTERRVAALNDRRIRFVNLPFQGPYPDPPGRWLVAGSPGMNVAAALATGKWIAPLDDDDEFVPDHVEVLLDHARRNRVEVAYGNIVQKPATPADPDIVLRSHPPQFGQFGFQAALYHGMLTDFFNYNTKSWLLDEPGDWNLARRMLEAGVRFGWLDQVVSVYYPSTLHAPRRV